MPTKIHMTGQYRANGGVTFNVSWDRIEDFLRGNSDRYADTNAKLEPHEECEFVITKDGISVYVVNKNDVGK